MHGQNHIKFVLVPFVHHKSHTDWPGVEHKNSKGASVCGCRQCCGLQVLQPNVPATVAVLAELSRWEQNYVDVAALRSRTEQAERDSETLGEKVALLERRVQVGRRMTAAQTAGGVVSVLAEYRYLGARRGWVVSTTPRPL